MAPPDNAEETFCVANSPPQAAVGICVPITELVSGGAALKRSWKPAVFLGMAMVARGEIGLLIIQVGLNETPYLSEAAFVTAAWAIILNTIIGPMSVGLLLGRQRLAVYNDENWGVQGKEADLGDDREKKKGWRGWADRGARVAGERP